jgi:pyruvate formate lyase activating enzyme
VDLKAFREETYRRYVGGRLAPTLENLKLMKRLGVWLEVTTLVIPEINDDRAELSDAARFVAQELGPETPWHISRFFPNHEMTDRPPTPVRKLQEAREIGRTEGLRYVYLGNVSEESNTICHGCGRMLIRRRGYLVTRKDVRSGRCPACRTPVAGVGMDGSDEAVPAAG